MWGFGKSSLGKPHLSYFLKNEGQPPSEEGGKGIVAAGTVWQMC